MKPVQLVYVDRCGDRDKMCGFHINVAHRRQRECEFLDPEIKNEQQIAGEIDEGFTFANYRCRRYRCEGLVYSGK